MKSAFYLLTSLLFLTLVACEPQEITPNQIWDGPLTTFTKERGADPNEAANQDRLSEDVYLTRGNNGGQIYNAAVENSADQDKSPKGTKWAIGTIDQIETLDFKPFREAVGKPKQVVGKDLVLFLEKQEIYLSVKFTQWTAGKGGGFAYERSTP